MILEPFQVALSVADTLERCGVPYVVGGSLASSVSGEPRSTLDIDLVVAMTEADVEPFLATLGEGFHADDHALRHTCWTSRICSTARSRRGRERKNDRSVHCYSPAGNANTKTPLPPRGLRSSRRRSPGRIVAQLEPPIEGPATNATNCLPSTA